MAITIDGIPVSGSIGLTTFGRNRSGAYKRRRTKPVNPNSSLQVFLRNAFRGGVTNWTDVLTPIERESWDTWASAVPWLNKAGESIRITGQNAYVRAYTMWMFATGLAPPNTAPALFSTGAFSITLDSVTYDTSANTVSAAITAVVAENAFQVEDGFLSARVSQPANPSVNFPPNRFAFFNTYNVPAVPVPAIVVAAAASPFVFQTGQRVWVRARASTPDALVSSEVLLGPVTVTVVP